MTASLIIAGYEVIDNAAAPQWRLATLGWVKGDALPDQAEIVNGILDGESVTGKRTRNRHPRFPLWVTGTSALDLAANVNAIWQAVSEDTFTVQWTPDGGLPVVYDNFHARIVRPNNQYLAGQFVTALMIECDALPFGRSPTAQTAAASTTTQIDSYDTAPTGGTLSTTNKVEGTGSAVVTSGTPVSRSFAAKDLSAASQVTFWEQVTKTGSGSQFYNVAATLTLTSASGSTRYTMTPKWFSVGGVWALLSIPLTGGTVTAGSGVTLSAVTSYSFTLTYAYGTAVGTVGTKTQYIDDLRAVGTALTLTGPTTHAAVLGVPGVLGAARTPVNIALTNASTFNTCLLHSPPVTQDDQAQILTALSTAADQTVTIAAANAGFRGTYIVMLGIATAGAAGTRRVDITITQKENGTTVGSVTVLSKTYLDGPRLIPIGEVTLPLYDTPADNTATSYTVRVQEISGADQYSELMLCDVAGQTIWTDTALATAVAAVYVDEPSALQSGPPVYGSATDRTAAYSIAGNCVVTGGPILHEPGTNKMLAWVNTGTPAVAETYFSRWPDERSS